MTLFAVSLLFDCLVAGSLLPDSLHELSVHVVRAGDEAEALARGAAIGVGRQHAYRNGDGEEVSWVFRRVVECQDILARDLAEGMEVSSWLYRGERLCLNDGWSAPPPGPG